MATYKTIKVEEALVKRAHVLKSELSRIGTSALPVALRPDHGRSVNLSHIFAVGLGQLERIVEQRRGVMRTGRKR